ncbi:histidine kinase [Halalkaliarchaeum sp. AArc-GB]|uniref:DICT sensory domain-containing protein n=1 Tax=Halalkaliarchaeum sp. AArc-GB TaxID=3074078 RepID=UPI002863B454|nr:DICT sensory domain-containing protein [Halalkaliarchaeum sp. AArc-GB]MDR5674172.1 histidine kinase [Halalkaliarchaeum sp. AArc-GB]
MGPSLEQFFDSLCAPPRSLLLVNRSQPEPLVRILERTFEGQPVNVSERDLPDADSDVVVLVEESESEADPRVIATSPLSSLEETILLVNSDLYKTGTAGFSDGSLPAVLTGLEEVPFVVRSYPESNKEKLLLIAMSRFIERRAYRQGAGRLRTSFQRLSRIEDERGTRKVYRTLDDSEVQTHVYGIPDWRPSTDSALIAHGGYTEAFRKSWFVVYTPSDSSDSNAESNEWVAGEAEAPHAALVGIETESERWRGFWTFRPSLVREIDAFIARNL